jgi:hypothetical protein
LYFLFKKEYPHPTIDKHLIKLGSIIDISKKYIWIDLENIKKENNNGGFLPPTKKRYIK